MQFNFDFIFIEPIKDAKNPPEIKSSKILLMLLYGLKFRIDYKVYFIGQSLQKKTIRQTTSTNKKLQQTSEITTSSAIKIRIQEN